MFKPLVTCICNTKSRSDLLARSIECFKAQTYQRKELLIVYEDSDSETKTFIDGISDETIRCLEVPSGLRFNLGNLRNRAAEMASGDVICIWDDDDWYHVRRIEIQVTNLETSHKPASVMNYILIYNSAERQAYLGSRQMWAGSLLCKKSTFKNGIRYGDVNKGEDRDVLSALLDRNMIYPLIMPQLYIYVYHQRNTLDSQHFERICNLSQKLSFETSVLIGHILSGKFAANEASNILSSPEVLNEFRYVP